MKSKSQEPLVSRLIAESEKQAGDVTVVEVRIGMRYTGVRLEDGRCGVAYTFREAGAGACGSFQGLRPLAGRRADVILGLLASLNPIEARSSGRRPAVPSGSPGAPPRTPCPEPPPGGPDRCLRTRRAHQ